MIDWGTAASLVVAVVVIIGYLQTQINRLRDEMREGFAASREDIRELRSAVHNLDVRVARLEGKTEAEAEAEIDKPSAK